MFFTSRKELALNPSRSRLSRSGSRPHLSRRLTRFEQLEHRTLLATFAGGAGAIADNSTTNFTLTVPDSITVADINVQLDISHRRDQDLDVYLIAPDLTRVELMTDVGGNGDNFTATVIDDEASTSIAAGSAPFTGSFQPEGSLSDFDGADAQGTWTLEITDDKRRESGTLNSWSIEITPATVTSAEFIPLGFLPAQNDSNAWRMSPDGRFVVGNSGSEAFRWSRGDGMIPLGMFDADDVSADGSVVVGGDGVSNAYRWDSGTLSVVGDLTTIGRTEDDPGGTRMASIHSVSADGSVMVGNTALDFKGEADSFRIVGSVIEPIGDLPGGVHNSGARAVSADGSVVFGAGHSASGKEAYRWENGIFTPLGDLPGGAFSSLSFEVSGNGQYMVGQSESSAGLEAFLWSAETGMVGLGHLPGETTDSRARGVSDDGSVVVGLANIGQSIELIDAFIWDEFNGMRNLQSVLIAEYGLGDALAGWTLNRALAISDDGLIITGVGTNPSGLQEAFLVDLDPPPTLSIDDVTVTEGDESIQFIDAFITAGSGGLDNPKDLIFGPDGNLYVIGGLSDNVVRYDATSGELLGTFVTAGSGGLDGPQDLLFGPDGNLYVTSRLTNEVLRYNGATGAFIDAFITAGSDGLDDPGYLTFGVDGNLYVSSNNTNEVLRYDGTTGAALGAFVTQGNGGLDQPNDLAFGPDGNLYVVGLGNEGVLRFDGTSGAFIDTFVTSGSGGLDDPVGLVFGPDGDLYVASALGDSVLRYDGSTGAFLEAYVSAGSGGLDRPIGLLFDADGNLYVSSRDTDEVLRYGAASQAVFTVNLSSPSVLPVTVDFSTADGTAKDGVGETEQDYTATSGTVVFDPGVTTRVIIVPTLDDADQESAESFFVNLSNAIGAPVQDAQGEATINDDDTPFSSDDMYVWDIAFETRNRGKGGATVDARVLVTVLQDDDANGADAADAPVAGADVTVVLSGPRGGTYSGTTDASGVFTVDWIKNLPDGTYYADVTTLDDPSQTLAWNPALDQEDDSNGNGDPDAELTLAGGAASAMATDLALLAWAEPDSSDEDDTDSLAAQAADELALMMMMQ